MSWDLCRGGPTHDEIGLGHTGVSFTSPKSLAWNIMGCKNHLSTDDGFLPSVFPEFSWSSDDQLMRQDWTRILGGTWNDVFWSPYRGLMAQAISSLIDALFRMFSCFSYRLFLFTCVYYQLFRGLGHHFLCLKPSFDASILFWPIMIDPQLIDVQFLNVLTNRHC